MYVYPGRPPFPNLPQIILKKKLPPVDWDTRLPKFFTSDRKARETFKAKGTVMAVKTSYNWLFLLGDTLYFYGVSSVLITRGYCTL